MQLLLLALIGCVGEGSKDDRGADSGNAQETGVSDSGDTADPGDTDTGEWPYPLDDCGSDMWGVGDGNITDLYVPADYNRSYGNQWTANCAFYLDEPRNYHLNCPADATLIVSYFIGADFPTDVGDYVVSGEDEEQVWLETQTAGVQAIIVVSDDYGKDNAQAYLCVTEDEAVDPSQIWLRI